MHHPWYHGLKKSEELIMSQKSTLILHLGRLNRQSHEAFLRQQEHRRQKSLERAERQRNKKTFLDRLRNLFGRMMFHNRRK